MTASAWSAAGAATAAPSLQPAVLASQAGNVPLTRVSLAYLEHRFKLYLRFGEPARTLQLDRWRRWRRSSRATMAEPSSGAWPRRGWLTSCATGAIWSPMA